LTPKGPIVLLQFGFLCYAKSSPNLLTKKVKERFFRRIFKTPNTYLSREWVRNLYKALKNFNWNYLTSEKFGLSPKEKEILSNSDSKRHRFMEIIKETTNISDS